MVLIQTTIQTDNEIIITTDSSTQVPLSTFDGYSFDGYFLENCVFLVKAVCLGFCSDTGQVGTQSITAVFKILTTK